MIEKGESWVEANEHALQLVRPQVQCAAAFQFMLKSVSSGYTQ